MLGRPWPGVILSSAPADPTLTVAKTPRASPTKNIRFTARSRRFEVVLLPRVVEAGDSPRRLTRPTGPHVNFAQEPSSSTGICPTSSKMWLGR